MEAGQVAGTRMSGTLFIVATPIGNLADISERALQVLRSVAVVAVEDTRHSNRLLQHYGIRTPVLAYHDFNEKERAAHLLARVAAGESIALVSDAGTPLVSDPGYHLVRQAQALGLPVVPVPGACAAIAALSCAGLASDRFTFEGFLPARTVARRSVLESLREERRTMIFYEAPHRILECLVDMVAVFGPEREVTLARELTKTFETIRQSAMLAMLEFVTQDADQQKGEIVLVVAGNTAPTADIAPEALHTLRVLLDELPVKQAAALAARITGVGKNLLYDAALQWKHKKD
jgi:16S rRNA (cytidine1402-2'-O)-methyltransferase